MENLLGQDQPVSSAVASYHAAKKGTLIPQLSAGRATDPKHSGESSW